MSYNKQFYDTIREGCQASARLVVPTVYDLINPSTVVDVGCGEGWWGKAFEDMGASVVGMDGAYAKPVLEQFRPIDLAHESLDADEAFDLAVCLEVAEHLAPERAEGFIAELCGLAPIVLFSAAIPGQTGAGHVNCQWPAYWTDLFARCDFVVSGALRFQFWDDVLIEPWYRQNLMLAADSFWLAGDGASSALRLEFMGPLAVPYPVVHPEVWQWKL